MNALYWARVDLAFNSDYTPDNATPESRKAWLALSDLWERKRKALLLEFVHNDNVSKLLGVLGVSRLQGWWRQSMKCHKRNVTNLFNRPSFVHFAL